MTLMERLCCSVGFAILTATPLAAMAQQATPNSAGGSLEEIIVSAQRTRTDLQKTPVAVTAFSEAQLSQKGVTNLINVADFTPSLEVNTRSGSGAAAGGLTIRGIGTDGTASSPAVGIYIDDVYYPSYFGNLLGTFDIANLEVDRGPQGTLFGRNTIAGAVQFTTNKPDHVFGGFAEGTFGSYGKEEGQAALNIPLTDDLAIRLSGQANSVGGFVHDNYTGADRGAENTRQGKIQLRWTPVDTLTVDLKAEILHDENNGRAIAITAVNPKALFPTLATLPAAFVPFPFSALRTTASTPLTTADISPTNYTFAGFSQPDYARLDYQDVQAVENWQINNDLAIKSISSYSYTRTNTKEDFDNSDHSIFYVSRGVSPTKLFTQELQLRGQSFANRLKWTAGFYYFDSEAVTTDFYSQLGPNGNLSPAGDSDIQNNAKAVYGQADYSLTDDVTAELGIRYSAEDVTGSYVDTAIPSVFLGIHSAAIVRTPNPAFPAETNSFYNLSPHFLLKYQITPDAMVYASASKGFRAGGFAVSTNLPGGFSKFAPETAWTYELGTRLQFLNNKLRFNPTFYYTEWNNIQFNTFYVDPVSHQQTPIVNNAGDGNIKGLELETQYAVTPQLLVNMTGSYMSTQYTRIAPLVDLALSDPFQHAPEFKVAFGVRYTVPFDNGASLVTSANYSWTDGQHSAVVQADNVDLPAYGLLNARFDYHSASGWSLAVYGTNLTDKYYYIGAINGVGNSALNGVAASNGNTGTTEADLGRRREVGISARYDF